MDSDTSLDRQANAAVTAGAPADKSGGMPPYMAFIILVSGVVGGLLLVVAIIMLWKHCAPRLKQKRGSQELMLTNTLLKPTDDTSGCTVGCGDRFLARSYPATLPVISVCTDVESNGDRHGEKADRTVVKSPTSESKQERDTVHRLIPVGQGTQQTGAGQRPRSSSSSSDVPERTLAAGPRKDGSGASDAAALEGAKMERRPSNRSCSSASVDAEILALAQLPSATLTRRTSPKSALVSTSSAAHQPIGSLMQTSQSTIHSSVDSADNRSVITVIEAYVPPAGQPPPRFAAAARDEGTAAAHELRSHSFAGCRQTDKLPPRARIFASHDGACHYGSTATTVTSSAAAVVPGESRTRGQGAVLAEPDAAATKTGWRSSKAFANSAPPPANASRPVAAPLLRADALSRGRSDDGVARSRAGGGGGRDSTEARSAHASLDYGSGVAVRDDSQHGRAPSFDDSPPRGFRRPPSNALGAGDGTKGGRSGDGELSPLARGGRIDAGGSACRNLSNLPASAAGSGAFETQALVHRAAVAADTANGGERRIRPAPGGDCGGSGRADQDGLKSGGGGGIGCGSCGNKDDSPRSPSATGEVGNRALWALRNTIEQERRDDDAVAYSAARPGGRLEARGWQGSTTPPPQLQHPGAFADDSSGGGDAFRESSPRAAAAEAAAAETSSSRRARFQSFLVNRARTRLLDVQSSTDRSLDDSFDTASMTEGGTASESSRKNTTSFDSSSTTGADSSANEYPSRRRSLAGDALPSQASEVAAAAAAAADSDRRAVRKGNGGSSSRGGGSLTTKRRRDFQKGRRGTSLDESDCSDTLEGMPAARPGHATAACLVRAQRSGSARAAERQRPPPPSRDYSIDEKTDAIFREFLRVDPAYEQKQFPCSSKRTQRFSKRNYGESNSADSYYSGSLPHWGDNGVGGAAGAAGLVKLTEEDAADL